MLKSNKCYGLFCAALGAIAACGAANASPIGTEVVVTSSMNPVLIGAAVTFTATVTAGGYLLPGDGIVTFREGDTLSAPIIPGGGAVALTDGVATFVTSFATAGDDTIVAEFAGNTDYSGDAGLVNLVVDSPTPPPSTVPEPGSFALLAVGLLGLGIIRQRRAGSSRA